MNKLLTVGFFLLSAAVQAEKLSDQAWRIIENSDCLACHAIANPVVGPPFKDIAAKYKNNPKVTDTLVQKIQKGGSGNWGSAAMSPHPTMKNEDLKTVVSWILAGAIK